MTSEPVPALRIDGLGKWYRLAARERPTSLAEALNQMPRRLRGGRLSGQDGFWAVRDASFALSAGQALGLVGRNGAGKSTLLKMISRITAPTAGRIEVTGRVATLLEVGTGFHPELTGRENIFLNGSILGMQRREIEKNLDTIVEFAGVGRFLDEPVKRYSSGMGVRLAFAIAAHLESEVLLVDEVLAVGDAEFQKRCLGKMHDVADEGRAVIFVSHNLNAVQRLCNRALLLEAGRIKADGSPSAVVADYLSRSGHVQAGGICVIPRDADRFGTGEVRVRELALRSLQGEALTAVHFGQPFRVTILVEVDEDVSEAIFELGISSADGQRVLTAQNIDGSAPPYSLRGGIQRVEAQIATTLLPGEFVLDVGVHRSSGVTMDYMEQVMRLTALNTAEIGDDHYPWPAVRGYARPASEWSLPATGEESHGPAARPLPVPDPPGP